MKTRLECWIASVLSPLSGDGCLDGEAETWLRAHMASCSRHRARAPFPPPPICGEEERLRALERFRRRLSSAPQPFTLPVWLRDLLADLRAAPVPMATLSLVSLVLGLGSILHTR
jgi:hypothetical protein